MAELFFRKADHEPIEANQIRPETVEAVAVWCGGVAVVEHNAFNHSETYAAINVPTRSGMARATEDDWIVRAPEGYFFILGPLTFKEKFEPVK